MRGRGDEGAGQRNGRGGTADRATDLANPWFELLLNKHAHRPEILQDKFTTFAHVYPTAHVP